ncbi:MAG: family 43 glycosylhydrolase [Rikenellaceae bacterium]
MKRTLITALCALLFVTTAVAKSYCPVPLYTDPIFKGAADPEIVWNTHEQEWWIFYTSRRAVCEGAPLPALAIGVATSKDWLTWEHKGYIKIDGVGGEPMGGDVLWAPGIVREGDTYHMFLTYKKGNGRGERWGIPESLLLHLKAPASDLLNGWQTYKIMHVPFSSIDATLVKHEGEWNLFHRDIDKERKGVNTYRATTNNLSKAAGKWSYLGAAKGDVNDYALTNYHYQEAQYTFYWKGYYWLLTDFTSRGFPLYRSDDLEEWKWMGELMKEEGEAPTQKGPVRHPGVAVLGDRAFIFYFCQPYAPKKGSTEPARADAETCYIQVSELFFKDGMLSVDRDKRVSPPKNLRPVNDNWGFTK